MEQLVTIAIPAYKTTYLKEAIVSALSQTYTNIEVIVVDDKSPNNIKEIVDAFDDDRVKYYRNETNLGAKDPAGNWNRCLELAQGEYFALLCDDDLYKPTFVEEMLKLSVAYPDCNVFRSRCATIDKHGEVVQLYPSSPAWETSEDYMWHVFNDLRRQTISEFMYRTSYIKAIGGYSRLPLAWNADYISTFRLSNQGGIASVNQPLVCFRMSGENISSKSTHGLEKIEANLQAWQQCKELITENSPYYQLLIKTLDKWKYHLDRYQVAMMDFNDALQVFRQRKRFSLSVSFFVKCVIWGVIYRRDRQ